MASVKVFFSGQEQSTQELDKPMMVVGRDEGCEIRIDNLGISRQHCAILLRGAAFVVQDMGSSNGTFVNGKRVTEHYLNDGDEITIGVKYALHFRNEAQSKAAPAGELPDVPDTQNTYVVDGAKFQEKLAKMRAAAVAQGGPGLPPPGATAKDYANAMDPSAGAREAARLRTLLALSVGASIALLLALIVLTILYFSR